MEHKVFFISCTYGDVDMTIPVKDFTDAELKTIDKFLKVLNPHICAKSIYDIQILSY